MGTWFWGKESVRLCAIKWKRITSLNLHSVNELVYLRFYFQIMLFVFVCLWLCLFATNCVNIFFVCDMVRL